MVFYFLLGLHVHFTTRNSVPDNPLWLFCIKLADGIMKYIRRCSQLCRVILENFQNTIEKKNLANPKQVIFFEHIGCFCDSDNESETNLFKCLITMLSPNQPEANIQTLLELFLWVMYCSDLNRKHYIVIDNIEQYIKLNTRKIHIPNSDISKIYKSVNNVVINTTNAFDHIEQDLAWKAF